MADIQKYFEQFHVAIRTDYDISQELRDKRDIVVDRVQRYLKQHSLPGCRVLLQGSYKMKTGVKPIANLEYDIDIGLRFDFRPEDYKAEDVRQWVYEAVKDHTNRCEDRGPCVRVVYEKGFHLDLVIYATWDEGATELYRLERFSNRPCTTWGGRGTSARTDAGGLMRAYSMDLRERVLLDSDAGMKAADVAAKYRVSGWWVRLLKQRRRDTGEVAPRVQRHGRRCMLEPHLHTLADLIAAQPDRTLAELKDALATPARVPTVWRAVRALGLTV